MLVGQISYYPKLVAPDGSSGVYVFRYTGVTGLRDYYPFNIVAHTYTALAASMPLIEDNLAYHMSNRMLPLARDDLPLYEDSRINRVFDADILPKTGFLALNPGEGYGLLRVMDPDERPHPRDIVIYEALPNELPRVAGIVSTVPQTPLSHVNLRAVQDGVPNAYIRDALDNNAIADLLPFRPLREFQLAPAQPRSLAALRLHPVRNHMHVGLPVPVRHDQRLVPLHPQRLQAPLRRPQHLLPVRLLILGPIQRIVAHRLRRCSR